MKQTYHILGGGQVALSDQDFIAQGGEGHLYAQGQWVFKIYNDPQKMLPVAKIQELARLDRPNIIRPQAVLLDAKHQAVGLQMACVPDSVALPRLFTNDYRNAQQFDNSKVLNLLQKMQETISFIHAQGCLLVDGNEMNYLVDKQHREVYFIDVDSYQTPSFPATAIMPSIRDYHTSGFSELTDWFAFAIVACQLLIGIHPFKGKHPQFKKKDLATRMQAHVSVFNPRTSLPSAARDFSLIPPSWRDWFERLFEKGERLPPPALGQAASIVMPAPTLQSSKQLQVKLLKSYAAPLHACQSFQGRLTVLAGQQAYLDDGTQFPIASHQQIFYTPRSLQPMLVGIEQGQLQLRQLANNELLKLHLSAENLLLSDNQLFCVHHHKLTAIKLHELNNHCIASPGASWNIMPKAHQVLDGMVYQNVLGEPYLLLPYQAQACAVLPVSELRAYQIINGKYEAGVAMLVGYKAGQYDLLSLRFAQDFHSYQIEIFEDVEQTQVNFVALDNGVIVQLLQDGELMLLHRYQNSRRLVQDVAIHSDMRLCKNSTQVLAYQGEHLYAFSLT